MNVAEFINVSGLSMKSTRLPERLDGAGRDWPKGSLHFAVTFSIGGDSSISRTSIPLIAVGSFEMSPGPSPTNSGGK